MPAQEQFILKGAGPIDFGDYTPLTGTESMGYITALKGISCATSSLSFKPTVTVGTIEESCSGTWGTAFSYPEKQEFEVGLEMYGFDRDMLAIALNATTSLTTDGTVTNEAFPSVAVGDVVFLKNPLASSIVLTDSTPTTPVTLVEGTHYTVSSANHGRIVITNVTTLVQPIKAAYAFAASGGMAPSPALVTKSLIYSGKSNKPTGVGDTIHRLIVPKITWSMDGVLDLLSQKPTAIKLKGKVELATELLNNPRFKGFYTLEGLPA